MNPTRALPPLPGRLLLLGFGCVGQAVLPLLQRHLGLIPDRLLVVAATDRTQALAARLGLPFTVCRLTPDNLVSELSGRLAPGDFLVNLSVDVSSLDLLALCHARGALYLDTCIEPWAGGYDDRRLTLSQRSNHALREQALAWGRAHPGGPTAVLTQGANPGLISALLKQALLNLAGDLAVPTGDLSQRQAWADLARRLGVRVVHIAEHDSQVTARVRPREEFANTWSVAGFMAEGLQPAELGWGTHERHWPGDAMRHGDGGDAAVYLLRPGLATRVRSWTPMQGPYHGFLITHGESLSLSDHLSVHEAGRVVYRPTVHYAYRPCDEALLSIDEWAGRDWQPPQRRRVLRDEIVEGADELGVLLMGHARGTYWYGSRLNHWQARHLAPANSATSLQVAAGVLAGMVWALEHPLAGLVEPEDLDPFEVLAVARPYLGEVVGAYSDWTPIAARRHLFDEDMDAEDPWQFRNFRVS